MRKLSAVVRIATIAVPAAALLAFSTAAAARTPSPERTTHAQRPRTGWISQASSGQTLYVANGGNDTITLYDAGTTQVDPPVIGVIIDGITNPVALTVDAAGNLYVANGANGSQIANVVRYAKNAIHPAATYTKDVVQPDALATDKAGNLYVLNATGATFVGPSIVQFAAGSTSPKLARTDPNAVTGYSLAADARGDVFVGYAGWLCCPPPAVDEFLGKGTQAQPLAIAQATEGGVAAPPLSLALDDSGNIVTADGTQIAVYAPTAQVWPAVAPPIATSNIGRPQAAIAFGSLDAQIFGLDATQNLVVSYKYPSFAYNNIYMQGIEAATAIAVAPWQAPPAPSPQPPPPHLPKQPPHATLYVAAGIGEVDGQILEYTELGKQRKGFTISVGISKPSGLAVDAQKTLYVANRNTNAVTEYPYNQLIPTDTLTNGLTAPAGVAVSGDGTLAMPLFGLSEIVVYPKGASSSPIVLAATGAISVALDSSDDVYYSDGASVYEFPLSGSTYGAPETLFGGVKAPPITESLALDGSANIVVPIAQPAAIGVFAPGSSAPAYIIGNGILMQPLWFALDPTQHFLYVLDNQRGAVLFRYPSGTPVAQLFGVTTFGGIAVAPAAKTGPPWNPAANRGSVR